jgi:hypothetical protein
LPHSITAEFDVQKPGGATVYCTLRARDLYSNVVGQTIVPVSGADTAVHVVYQLQVTSKANTVEVTSCTPTRSG